MIRRSLLLGAAALLLGGGTKALAFGNGCCRCGCHDSCEKVCRVVCTKKTVKEPVYECKEVHICLPGKSTKVPCDCPDGCCRGHRFHWEPGCGEVRTVRKVIKTERTKEVCEYKWVVEYLCPKCKGDASPSDAPLIPKQAEMDRASIPVSTDYFQK